MPKHVDKLRTLLAQLDCKFSFIGIYWHMRLEILLSWFMNTVSLDTINSPLLLSLLQEEYLCMSQTLFLECLGMISHSCYLASNLEYAFVKVNLPNRTNITVSPSMYASESF